MSVRAQLPGIELDRPAGVGPPPAGPLEELDALVELDRPMLLVAHDPGSVRVVFGESEGETGHERTFDIFASPSRASELREDNLLAHVRDIAARDDLGERSGTLPAGRPRGVRDD